MTESAARELLARVSPCFQEVGAFWNPVGKEWVEVSAAIQAILEASKDTDLLDWLSVPGRWVSTQERDLILSYHLERKQVEFYVDGVFTVVCGDTLREAILAAVEAAKKPEEETDGD